MRIAQERAEEIQMMLASMDEWTCTDEIKRIVQDFVNEINVLSEVVITLHEEIRVLKRGKDGNNARGVET